MARTEILWKALPIPWQGTCWPWPGRLVSKLSTSFGGTVSDRAQLLLEIVTWVSLRGREIKFLGEEAPKLLFCQKGHCPAADGSEPK